MTPLTFIIFQITLSAIALYLLVRNVRNGVFLFLFIPAVLLFASTTVVSVHDLMGKPTSRLPGKPWIFLDVWTDGKVIYVWHLPRGQSYPETFKLPYERETFKKLQEAKRGRDAGKTTLGRPLDGKEQGKVGDEESKAPFTLYDFTLQEGGFSKDPPR